MLTQAGIEIGPALSPTGIEGATWLDGNCIYRVSLLDVHLPFRKEETACPRFLRKAV
jgi:hypothetical protein